MGKCKICGRQTRLDNTLCHKCKQSKTQLVCVDCGKKLSGNTVHIGGYCLDCWERRNSK